MSLPLVLALLAFGIALSQAACAARAVTLQWLRLGDLIALSLLGIGGAAMLIDPPEQSRAALHLVGAILVVTALAHLMLVQSGWRSSQRLVVSVGCAAVVLALSLGYVAEPLAWMQPLAIDSSASQRAMHWPIWFIGPALALTGWLTGGSLMAMLLGHAYLTSGSEMTQQPFLRLVRLLLIALALRLALALFGALLPWWLMRDGAEPQRGSLTMAVLLLCARFLVGLVVPLIMTWMALQCVRIRSNQSATGILYVSSTMILIGEFVALSLATAHGLPF